MIENMLIDNYRRNVLFVGIFFSVAIGLTLAFFSAPINYSGLPINGTGEPTQIAAQTVPTIVNGITTVTSIVVALCGVLFGTIIYREIAKEANPKRKNEYFALLGVLIFPELYLMFSYVFLGFGLFLIALRWALSSFIVAILIFVLFYIQAPQKLWFDKEKKDEQNKPEQDKSKPTEKEENDNKDTVNPEVKKAIVEDVQTNNIKIALKANSKPRSRLGYVVGSVIEFSFEVANIDSRPFSGGTLAIIITPANGIFVRFTYPVKSLQPNEKTIIEKNSNGDPLTTNVLASGFTLFSAQMDDVDIYSPPQNIETREQVSIQF
jgi:hypothetical protein